VGDAVNPACTPISAAHNDNAVSPDPVGTTISSPTTLHCGRNYYLTDITLRGGDSITIAGSPCPLTSPARVYLDGSSSVLGGSSLNPDGVSTDLTLYGISASSGQSIQLGGNVGANVNIYAPTYQALLNGQGRTFGNVSANVIDIKGVGGFTFDEALGLPPTFTTSFTIKVQPDAVRRRSS